MDGYQCTLTLSVMSQGDMCREFNLEVSTATLSSNRDIIYFDSLARFTLALTNIIFLFGSTNSSG